MPSERSAQFQKNAARLRALHEAIHKTYELRDKSPRHRQAWSDACEEFHHSYDALAFPGGLRYQIERLKAGHADAVELAIQFLEENPMFHRSGYLKEGFIAIIKRAALTEKQESRLKQLVIERIQVDERREFRSYCALAKRVRGDEFRSRIAALTESGDAGIRRRAGWVLAALDRAQPTTR